MQENGFDQLPVVDAANHLIGLVTLGGILAKIGSNRVQIKGTVDKAMYSFKQDKKFTQITLDTPLESLSKFFEKNPAAVVTSSDNGALKVLSICTKVDLLAFLVKKA